MPKSLRNLGISWPQPGPGLSSFSPLRVWTSWSLAGVQAVSPTASSPSARGGWSLPAPGRRESRNPRQVTRIATSRAPGRVASAAGKAGTGREPRRSGWGQSRASARRVMPTPPPHLGPVAPAAVWWAHQESNLGPLPCQGRPVPSRRTGARSEVHCRAIRAKPLLGSATHAALGEQSRGPPGDSGIAVSGAGRMVSVGAAAVTGDGRRSSRHDGMLRARS